MWSILKVLGCKLIIFPAFIFYWIMFFRHIKRLLRSINFKIPHSIFCHINLYLVFSLYKKIKYVKEKMKIVSRHPNPSPVLASCNRFNIYYSRAYNLYIYKKNVGRFKTHKRVTGIYIYGWNYNLYYYTYSHKSYNNSDRVSFRSPFRLSRF